ncbi:hypothetical protein PSK36_22555 [Escherichia coli]|nr:hypothetical protein [Escherichia coli]
MISSLIDENTTPTKVGEFSSKDQLAGELFSNVVSVTFSAFDETEPLSEKKKDKSTGIQFSYVGLKKSKKKGDEKSLPPKSPVILKK